MDCASCLADTLFFFGLFALVLIGTPLAIAYRRGRGSGSAPPLEASPDFQFGGFMRRAVAVFLDAIVLYGVLMAAAVAQIALPPPLLFVTNLAWLGVSVAYLPAQWAMAGRTLGMRVLGLRVVRGRDGGKIGWGTSPLRFMGWIISGFAMGLGWLWIAFEPRKRGWHDLIADTVVIRQSRTATPAGTLAGSE